MFDSVTSAHGHASAPPRIAIAVNKTARSRRS